MKLTPKKNGNDLTILLSGELNTLTTPELTALLHKAMGGVKNLTLDFAECDLVSSAGLRMLLETFKQMRAAKGSMKLINVGENFMDVLHNTGLDAVFGIH